MLATRMPPLMAILTRPTTIHTLKYMIMVHLIAMNTTTVAHILMNLSGTPIAPHPKNTDMHMVSHTSISHMQLITLTQDVCRRRAQTRTLRPPFLRGLVSVRMDEIIRPSTLENATRRLSTMTRRLLHKFLSLGSHRP